MGKSKIDMVAKRELFKGLELLRNYDGHWLCFKASNGKRAMINLECHLAGMTIIKDAVLQWADDVLSN